MGVSLQFYHYFLQVFWSFAIRSIDIGARLGQSGWWHHPIFVLFQLLFITQLPATREGNIMCPKYMDPAIPAGDPDGVMGLDSAWLSLTHQGHLCSEPANRRSFSRCLSHQKHSLSNKIKIFLKMLCSPAWFSPL